jgi:hypothetical protein
MLATVLFQTSSWKCHYNLQSSIGLFELSVILKLLSDENCDLWRLTTELQRRAYSPVRATIGTNLVGWNVC